MMSRKNKRGKKKKQINKKIKARDYNILAAFKKEIDMREKKIPNKKKYSRKNKHKGETKND